MDKPAIVNLTNGKGTVMGESKRRRTSLGEDYGKPEPAIRGLPFSKESASKFVAWSTTGAWVGIFFMVATWITIRFVGPGLGWWTLTN